LNENLTAERSNFRDKGAGWWGWVGVGEGRRGRGGVGGRGLPTP